MFGFDDRECAARGCDERIHGRAGELCDDCKKLGEKRYAWIVRRVHDALESGRSVILSHDDLKLAMEDVFASTFVGHVTRGELLYEKSSNRRESEAYGRNRGENERQQECRYDCKPAPGGARRDVLVVE